MMSPRRSIPTTDRIIDLPDPILCHILSFLPTKFAATTSVLSKRWKPLWLSVQTLDFDDNTFHDLDTLRSIMHSTIFLRDITLPIHSFRFDWNQYFGCGQMDVNEIVSFVLKRGIQNFYLRPNDYYWRDIVELPVNILSCRTLKVLKLTNIMVGDISHNMDIHLPILKSFHLDRVRFVCDDNFEKLLLACPILQDLAMINSSPFKYLINFPTDIKLKALPNLIKARICENCIPMTMISKAKILRLDPKTVTGYSPDPMFQNSPLFESLTQLELNFKDTIYWGLRYRWIWLLRRLKYFPNLQNLIIQDINAVEDLDHKYWEVPSIVPECFSSQLKTCRVTGYKGMEKDLKFAKYIIENSKVLETMIISSISSIDINVKNEMLVKLSSYTKGSTTCNLIFD